MNKLKNWIVFLFVFLGFVAMVGALSTDIFDFKVRGTSVFRVTSSGIVIAPFMTATTAVTAPYYGYNLQISTLTTKPSSSGNLAIDSTNTLYISTSSSVGGWVKVGGQ